MTTGPIAPVIPAGHRREGKAAAGRPVPLACPPGRPDVVYGFGRIDASGRVAGRATITALGWRGGDRLAGHGTYPTSSGSYGGAAASTAR
jgi:hypothetical protein